MSKGENQGAESNQLAALGHQNTVDRVLLRLALEVGLCFMISGLHAIAQ
jgi:hypothetical protein